MNTISKGYFIPLQLTYRKTLLRFLANSIICITLLIISSKIKIAIPFYPVPFNLQTMVVALLPLLYDKKTCITSVSSWIMMGCIGFPVFSGYLCGAQVILGPTGGYLIGMLLSTFLMCSLESKYLKKNPFVSCFFSFSIALLCGVSCLSTFLGLEKAFLFGFILFIPTELIKLMVCFKVCNLLQKSY